MSERYSRLFSLPENIGLPGSPVLISAGVLLKDTNTGKVLVQLKLRNISEQVVKSVKIKINAYDTAGCELKGAEAFSYLDLSVAFDEEFGNQTPIILPDKTTRSFSVEILSVAFMDGTAYIPSIHIAAGTLDSETLETVQLLDKERRERKEKQLAIQRENHIRLHHISYIPLLLSALAILLYIVNSIVWRFECDLTDIPLLKYLFAFYYFPIKLWLVSLIVPCLSILCYRKAEHKPILAIIAAGIAGIFLIIQIIQALVLNGIIPMSVYYLTHFYEFFTSIDGCELYFISLSKAPASSVIDFVVNCLFVVKNIVGFAALYLQAKNAKVKQ